MNSYSQGYILARVIVDLLVDYGVTNRRLRSSAELFVTNIPGLTPNETGRHLTRLTFMTWTNKAATGRRINVVLWPGWQRRLMFRTNVTAQNRQRVGRSFLNLSRQAGGASSLPAPSVRLFMVGAVFIKVTRFASQCSLDVVSERDWERCRFSGKVGTAVRR